MKGKRDMSIVHVRYGLAPQARSELGFAIDLARRLSASLFVWTEADAPSRALLAGMRNPSAAEREHAHVRDRVRLEIVRREARIVPTFCQGDPYHAVRDPRSILVGTRDAKDRPVAAAFATMGEASIVARGGGEVCLPFANGESALLAAPLAIRMAEALVTRLFLYHTTWRKRDLPDEAPPERHMNAEAAEVLRRIVEMAEDAGVGHRVRVETATAIAEGTTRAALDEHCALIVLARGRHVGCGSYVDQVLERSVTPVLVAGRSKA
jgi:hypothetical protein